MKKKTKLLVRDAFLSTILSCILFLILSIAFVNIRFFNPLHKAFSDFSFLDIYYSEKLSEDIKVNNQIILVNIKDYDRSVIASLLEAILKEKPKVVGFDIILEERPEKTKSDTLLANLLRNKKVVTSFEVKDESEIYSDPFFESKHEPGYTNFNFNDKTTVIRDFIGIKKIDHKKKTSLATKIAKEYLKKKQWKKYNYDEKLTKNKIIKFSGNQEKFTTLDLEDILLNDSLPILKNKVVILGYLGATNNHSTDIVDKFFTPLNTYTTGRSDADTFGVVIHANIVNMLINNDLITQVSGFWLYLIVFLCMYFSTMLYMKLNKKYKITYRTRKQTYQFIFSITLLILVFWLYSIDISLSPFPIIVGIVLAGGYFKYYKHLTRYINTKRKWKTYLK